MENEKQGFTLIELLVVIAIIGVLSGIGLVILSGARAKARDVRRIADLRLFGLAMMSWHDSNGNSYDLNSSGDIWCLDSTQDHRYITPSCLALGRFFGHTEADAGNPYTPYDPAGPWDDLGCDIPNSFGPPYCCTGKGNYIYGFSAETDYSITGWLEVGTSGFPAGGIKVSPKGLHGMETPAADGGCGA